MTATPTADEFAALLRQAGLTLPADQQARLIGVFGAMRAMQDGIRQPAAGETLAPADVETAAAEPATTFAPTTFTAEPGR